MAASASRPGGQQLDAEAGLFQIAAHQFGDVAVVFDDEDARHDPAATPSSVTVGAAASAAAASATEV